MSGRINVTPEFVLAGEATFTVSNGDGEHYTFHVYKTEPSTQYPQIAFFIKALAGPDNTSDYRYMGKLRTDPEGHLQPPFIIVTGRSNWREGADILKVARWALRVIWSKGEYQLPNSYSIQHDGNCGRCGRKLTTPASLDTGLGPECAEILGVEWAERNNSRAVKFDFEGGR